VQINRLVLVVVVFTFWAGCTIVGKGTRTVIKQPCCDNLSKYYPNLVASCPPSTDLRDRMVAIPANTDVNPDAFRNFMLKRYGTEKFEAAELSATIRDRNTMPPFLPVDALSKILNDKIAAIVGNEKLSQTEKEQQGESLRDLLLNLPDLTPTTALHHKKEKEKKEKERKGSTQKTKKILREVNFYYPRVQIDFSSRLLTNSPLDRFDFLGMVVKIKNNKTHRECFKDGTHRECFKDGTHREYSVRFVDFSPKDADIVEFTRGQFTQSAQLQAKGTVALEPSGSQTKLGGELSYTQTEVYASELKDALEKRTTSILNNGELFVAEFRAIREKRIGGTYNFDLMLEIPATIEEVQDEPGSYTSEPIITQINVDIYLVGVVRHVYKRGMKGFFFSRVPESENDNVYETVVREVLENKVLWAFQGEPWDGKDDTDKPPQITVTVVTNRDDARFILSDEKGTVLGQGGGKEAKIIVDNKPVDNTQKKAPDRKWKLTFLPIVSQANNGRILKLKAPSGEIYSIQPGEAQTFTAVGKYFD
jgi:hypothetical protein